MTLYISVFVSLCLLFLLYLFFKARNRYSSILDHLREAVIMVDSKSAIQYANHAALEIFEYQNTPLLGKSFEQLLSKTYQTFLKEVIQDYFSASNTEFMDKRYEINGISSNDKQIPIELTFSKVNNSANRLLLIIIRDISIQKKIELEKQMEYKHRAILIDVLNEISFEYLEPNKKLIWSHHIEKVLGYTTEELVSSIDGWFGLVHPDELPSVQRHWNEAIIQQSEIDLEYRMRDKHGDYWWFHHKGRLIFDAEGKLFQCISILKNITLWKSGIVALQKDRDRFVDYMDTADVLIVSLLQNGKIEMVNKKTCELLGHPQSRIEGHAFWNFVPNEDRTKLQQVSSKIFREEKELPKQFEQELTAKNGNRYLVLWRIAKQLDDKGKISNLLLAGIDLTEQKELEKKYLTKHLLFESIFKEIPDGLVIADLDRNIQQLNPALERIFGYSKQELLGKNTIFLYASEEEYAKQGQLRFNQNTNALLTAPYLVQYKRKSGDTFFGETVGTPIKDSDGEVQGYLGVIRDVTSRINKEREIRDHKLSLQTALDAIEGGLFVYDICNNVIQWDERSRKLFGVGDEDFPMDVWSERVHPEDVEQTVAHFNDALANSNRFELKYRIIRDNKVHHIHSFGIIIRDEENLPILTKGINLDITKEITTQEEHKLLNNQLQQAQKMESIGQLTGGIAHDFNNILGSIIGYTHLAKERGVAHNDELIGSYLEQVETSSLRARDLIKQLLVFSRSNSVDNQPIDIEEAVTECLKLLKPTLTSAIKIDYKSMLKDTKVTANIVQLNQVLLNLAINARDAMNNNGILKVRLDTVHINDSYCASCHSAIHGDYISIEVSDNGTGIKNGLIPTMFDPFVTTKAIGKGTGMGLSMVHGIVHQLQGHITVNSKEGRGTSFTLLMKEFGKKDRKLSKPRILLVDDETCITTLFEQALASRGFEIDVFTNSRQALSKFRDNPAKYDVVITDQTMPDLTGVELAKEILNIKPDIPILMQTGYSDYLNEANAKQIGIKTFLSKPVSLTTMVSELRNLVKEHCH